MSKGVVPERRREDELSLDRELEFKLGPPLISVLFSVGFRASASIANQTEASIIYRETGRKVEKKGPFELLKQSILLLFTGKAESE